MVIPKRFGFAAPRLRVNLLFQKQVVMNNSGVGYANIRFAPTNAYDVDPDIGSSAMAGFAQYAYMYRFYRVHSSRILVDFVNQESFGTMVYVAVANSDPGVGSSTCIAFLQNPRTKQITLGPATGTSTGVIRSNFNTSQMGGVSSLSILDEYSALTSGSPNNNWWWVIGAFSAANLSSGIFISLRIEVEVEFFEFATIL
jgi:hypothetical protein